MKALDAVTWLAHIVAAIACVFLHNWLALVWVGIASSYLYTSRTYRRIAERRGSW